MCFGFFDECIIRGIVWDTFSLLIHAIEQRLQTRVNRIIRKVFWALNVVHWFLPIFSWQSSAFSIVLSIASLNWFCTLRTKTVLFTKFYYTILWFSISMLGFIQLFWVILCSFFHCLCFTCLVYHLIDEAHLFQLCSLVLCFWVRSIVSIEILLFIHSFVTQLSFQF